MEVDDLFENRLLKKVKKDPEKVGASLRIAESKLDESRRLFSAEFYGNALLNVYTSMFHSARAILYNDGVQEKSHYAVYVYIRENFSRKIPLNLINSFNRLREERHEILYGFEEDVSTEFVEIAILEAEEFLGEVKNILNEK